MARSEPGQLRSTAAEAVAPAGHAVTLRLLHAPQLFANGAAVLSLPAKDAALLAMLALDGPTARAKAAAMLWPGVDSEGAHNNMRQRIFRLRRAVGRDIVIQGATLALAPGIAHDLTDPQAALAADAAALPGELLGAHDYDDNVELAQWVASAREQWRAARRDVLAAIAAAHEKADRVAAALPYSERLVREEPLAEHAARQLMRLHYRRGDRSAALAAYERLKSALDEQLGETTAPETQHLNTLIEASLELPVAAPPPTPVAVLRPPRLVGREREWALMEAAWARRQPVLLIGEPGIGKTRLISDFCNNRGAIARVQARPGDGAVPYSLLARLLRALWPAKREPSWPMASMDGWARSELARIVPELGVAAEGPMATLALRHATEHAIAEAKVAGIAIDDLQFADAASLEMLSTWVAIESSPCWLMTVRAAEVPAAMQSWLDAAEAVAMQRIELEPLDGPQVLALVRSLSIEGLDAETLAPALHRHTGGNPMFVLETLIALIARGGATSATTLPVPSNLGVLVLRRFAQLSPAAQRLARLAAIAGQDFSVELAGEVLEVNPLGLVDEWHELAAAQVLRGDGFTHDLIREAISAAVPPPLLRWLHGQVAQHLASKGSAPARLALHWVLAQDHEQAARSLTAAATQARLAGRRSEECSFLRKAAEQYALAGQQAQQFNVVTTLVIAAREAMSPDEALRVGEELLALALDDRQRGIASKEIAVCHMHRSRLDLARDALRQAIAHSSAAGDEFNTQHATYLNTMASVYVNGVEHAAARLESMLPWAQGLPDRELGHAFETDLAILLDQSDQRSRAAIFFERSIKFFDRTGDLATAAAARLMYSRSRAVQGDLARAIPMMEQALRLRTRVADGSGGQGMEAVSLGRMYVEAARYDEALTTLTDVRQRFESAGATVPLMTADLALVRLWRCLGQHARADSAMPALSDEHPFHVRATWWWTKSFLSPQGRAERLGCLQNAVAQFAQSDLPFVRVPIEFDLLLALGNTDALARCDALLAECTTRELGAARLLGEARRIELLLALAQPEAAAAAAAQWMLDVQARAPTNAYLPELFAAAWRAALAVGDTAAATKYLHSAVTWIERVADHHVPAPFLDSFKHRNPINREPLAAATRLPRAD